MRPLGLVRRLGLCGGWCSQGLVALSGLRTLGFEKGRPYRGLCGRWGLCGGWACVAVGVPRVWSPFQGCAPWALERVAPMGACVAVGGCAVIGVCAVIGGAAVGVVRRLVFPGFGKGRPYRGLRSHPRSVLILVSPWRGINPSSCQQAEMSAPRQRVCGLILRSGKL